MSILVENVVKTYGKQNALNGVSFQLEPGRIVGFLGPNGAGKSTIMKILTGYIPQTSGRVEVCGFDVLKDELEVKKRVGYLPEHNPLYLDMYVKEYLGFIAGLHKIKGKKDRIAEIIDLVGLGLEQRKKIGALSKGYRQRVGLAQALIHDPEVLILDEATTGLDPNQIEEIRNLIKESGKNKTVLMSTHIMQEVEAICDRVIIINKGNIVADDSAENIRAKTKGTFVLRVEFTDALPAKILEKELNGVTAENLNESTLRISSSTDIRQEIVKYSVARENPVLSLQKEEEKLEDVFRSLTSN